MSTFEWTCCNGVQAFSVLFNCKFDCERQSIHNRTYNRIIKFDFETVITIYHCELMVYYASTMVFFGYHGVFLMASNIGRAGICARTYMFFRFFFKF